MKWIVLVVKWISSKKKEKPSPVLDCYTFDATEYKSRKGCGGSIVDG